MCRTTDYHHGFHSLYDRLNIRAFYVRLSGLNSQKNLSDSLTLVYLPRINEKALDVDGSKIRSDSPAFVSLHRVLAAAKAKNGDAIFGSRERVRASEGIQFEVYLGEAKILKGIFRRDEDDEWKLECKCELVGDLVGDDGCKVSEAEVCVAVEGQGHVSMSEKVAMVVKKKKKHRKGFNLKGLELEEIPEEREVDTESLSDDCCCSSSCGGDSDITGSDAAACGNSFDNDEGVRWTVDLGIWVMCLGVGYLVSKASIKTLRRRRIF